MSAVTPWFPAAINPVRRGWYEVRNKTPLHWNARGKLVGRPFRYWSGHRWLTAEPGISWSEVSIFSTHPEHEWRGRAKTQEGERT